MPRYIDAENIDFSPLKNDFEKARAQVIIMGQPTADVEEVKHGKWVFNRGQAPDEKVYFCSLCANGESDYGNDNYCPYCGAKMDGGKVE